MSAPLCSSNLSQTQLNVGNYTESGLSSEIHLKLLTRVESEIPPPCSQAGHPLSTCHTPNSP